MQPKVDQNTYPVKTEEKISDMFYFSHVLFLGRASWRGLASAKSSMRGGSALSSPLVGVYQASMETFISIFQQHEPRWNYVSLRCKQKQKATFAFARQRAKKPWEEAREARRRPKITKIIKNIKIAIFMKKVIHLEIFPTLRIFYDISCNRILTIRTTTL